MIIGMDNHMTVEDYKAKILELLKKGAGVVTTNEVSHHFELSWNTAEKYLLELAVERKVERLKKVGVNLWLLKRERVSNQQQHEQNEQ